MKNKITVSIATLFSFLYIFCLFFPARKFFLLTENHWLTGWQLWTMFKASSLLWIFVLLLFVFSNFYLKKARLGLALLLFSNFILKYAFDSGGLYWPGNFSDPNSGLKFTYYLGFFLALVALIFWIISAGLSQKVSQSRSTRTKVLMLGIFSSLIYLFTAGLLSHFQFLNLMDRASLAVGVLTPSVTWKFLLILLLLLLLLSVRFEPRFSFTLMLCLFGIFLFPYLYILLNFIFPLSAALDSPQLGLGFYLPVLTGSLSCLIWLIYFKENSKI